MIKNNLKTALIAVAFGALLILSGCADSNTNSTEKNYAKNHPDTLTRYVSMSAPAGFWRGVWHGFCAPFSFFGIMFGMDIGIYDSFNTGNWYNFGFLLGIGALAGGVSSGTARRDYYSRN